MNNLKTKMAILRILMFIFLFPSLAFLQEPEWMNITSGGDANCVIDDGEFIWSAGIGLTKIHKATGEMTFYNKANCGLPSNHIQAITLDNQGNLWVGCRDLIRFDGADWSIYNLEELVLGYRDEYDYITCLDVDHEGNLWIGTDESGLLQYDGINWTVFHCDPPGVGISALKIDDSGNVWVAIRTSYNDGLNHLTGLLKYEDENWIDYYDDISIHTNACINSITFDINILIIVLLISTRQSHRFPIHLIFVICV